MFGETVSSYIRVLGSGRSDGTLGADPVQRQLQRAMRGATSVLPSQAIATRPGALARSHGVRCVIHVAAQVGFPLSGFTTVRKVGTCVECALEEVERQNRGLLQQLRLRPPLRRVLIPLFGTRNLGMDPIGVAKEIVGAAKRHLDLEKDTRIEEILFLASTDQDLELCEAAFRRLDYPVDAISWQVLSRGERPGQA